jgi:predicted amidohydrolase YtcJ
MRSRCCIAVALVLATGLACAAPQIIVAHADVFTGDPSRPRAQAVAIEDGRFVAVGSDQEVLALASPSTRIIDARGRLVTPGLVEAHVHLGSALPAFATPSPPLAMPDIPGPGPSGDEALARVAAAAHEPGDWITGFIGPRVARDPRNWRTALDAVARGRPVLLRAFWGHTTILDSAALQRLGIDEDAHDPIGGWFGRDAAGRLDGRAYESAEWIGWERIAPPDATRLAAVLQEASRRYARWGVTSIHLINNGRTPRAAVEALARVEPAQKWTVYAWGAGLASVAAAWQTIDDVTSPRPPRVRVDGPKWILDGTPIEENAWQRDPYPGRAGWRGRSNLTDAELREVLQRALSRPGQPILHVVGDAETDRLFRTMLSLAPAAAWAAKRVRVEHGDGIRADSVAMARQLGVVVTQNPTHLAPQSTGTDAPARALLLRSLLDGGIPLALGSDAGGDAMNPFLNIMLATTYASAPREALTREQALLAYTSGGAYAERQEAGKGRIVPGLAADMAMLSQDVLKVPASELPATRSVLTIVDGTILFEDPDLATGAPVAPR